MKKLLIAIILLAIPMFAFAGIPDKPTCDVGVYEGEWNGSEWVGKCVVKGGGSWLLRLPRVSWVRYENGVIDWLFSHFATGKIICSSVSHQFALNERGRPYDGTPVEPDLGNNYGYEIVLEQAGEWTYHRFEIPEWMTGKYCRTVSTIMGFEVLSQELEL
uniref:Uncharacterized protein n=1 Tax=viral metagenome TaxID=1070528 RepID=A0A6H1ZF11_9ZZZZ